MAINETINNLVGHSEVEKRNIFLERIFSAHNIMLNVRKYPRGLIGSSESLLTKNKTNLLYCYTKFPSQ